MMRLFSKLTAYTILICLFISTSEAHEAVSGASGFLHVANNAHHFSGFFIMGIIGGLHAYLFGARPFIIASFLMVTMLVSHAHISFSSATGIIFFLGFLSASVVAALIADRIIQIAIEKLHIRPRKSEND